MSRLTNRILLAALLGLFLTAPGIVRSQGFNARTLQRAQQRGETGNLYGTNPYEQTGEEGEEGQEADAPSSCDADAAGNEEPLAMRENEIAEPESEPLAAQKCGSPEQEGESPEGASSYGA